MRNMLVAAVLAIAGAHATAASPGADAPIDPMEAVQLAAEAEGRAVPGVFVLEVKGGGRDRRMTYLNSEGDYRDQRCLTIAITPRATAELERTHGAPLEERLRGRKLLVKGSAKRVRIDFTHDFVPTGKYYYQTHVRVDDARQISLQ